MYPGGSVEHLIGSEQRTSVDGALAVGGGDPEPADIEPGEVPHALTIATQTKTAVPDLIAMLCSFAWSTLRDRVARINSGAAAIGMVCARLETGAYGFGLVG